MTRKGLLAPRELEVLGYLFVGKTNREIGEILNTSPLTIKQHVWKITRRMNAWNRQHAVYKALCLGMLKVPQTDSPDEVPVPTNPLPRPIHEAPITDWEVLGNIEISEQAHRIKINGVSVGCFNQAFRLLWVFMHASGRVLEHDFLIEGAWGRESATKSNLTQHVNRVIAVLKQHGASHEIVNERGIGYRMQCVKEEACHQLATSA